MFSISVCAPERVRNYKFVANIISHNNDSKVANELIELLPQGEFVIADKGYDSEAIRDKVRERNASPVIPRKQNSKTGNGDIDWCLYKYRHLVENAFARLKR